MSKKKPKIGTCSICGNRNVKLTKDHVPPQTIFLSPHPDNMIDVPACDTCNGGSSILDQRFGVYVAMHCAPFHESAKKLFLFNTLATLNENKKLHRTIKTGLQPAHITYANGDVDTNASILQWDSVSFDSVIERTVRGLYWKHYKTILGNNAIVEVQFHNKIPDKFISLSSPFHQNQIGYDGEVIYKYLRDENNPFFSIWVLQFYYSLFAAGITKPK